MSVFHRVDDISVMPGRAFFRLAWRLPAYRGVMRERMLARQAQDDDSAAPAPQARYAPYAPPREVNPGTKATIQADPVLAGLISFA